MSTETEPLSTPELISIGRSLVERITASRLGEFEVLSDRIVNMGHLPLVHAFSRHTLRLGSVTLDLYDGGLFLEAVPTIRSAYECALSACWLAESREAPAAAYNEEQRQRRLLAATMAKAVSHAFQQGADEISLGDPQMIDSTANPQARSVEQLCSALSPAGPDAYVVYRALSAYTHGSLSLAEQYVQEAPSAAAGARLLVDPNTLDDDQGRTWLWFAVAAMVWSSRALDVMDRDHPNRDYLRRVARTLGTVDMLRLSEKARAAEAAAEQQRRRATWRGPNRRSRKRDGFED